MKKIFLLIGFIFSGCNLSFATLCTGIIPYATNGQVTSVNLNNNLTACQGTINGLLDNTNANVVSGYRFYQTVSSLPSAGSQGATYFLTSDNSLNLDNGVSFNKLISPSGVAAQGEVLFYGASGLTYTGVGTSGQPLISQGASANATFGNISAAGSVSAAAITSAPSMPAGAGLFPVANIGGLFGSPVSKSFTTVYQAATDGWVEAVGITAGGGGGNIFGITDSSSSPSTIVQQYGSVDFTESVSFYVKKNNYYEVTLPSGVPTSMTFTPIGS